MVKAPIRFGSRAAVGNVPSAFLHAVVLWCVCGGRLVGAPVALSPQPSERPQLKSIYAQTHDLAEFQKDRTRAILFVFLRVDCPVSQQYIARLQEIDAKYRARGVSTIGVFSGPELNIAEIAAFAHEHDLPFPVFQDVGHRLADLLDVQVTPEAVVLDGDLEKRYQGAIDNQFKTRGKLPAATENYLADAVEAVLAGRAPTKEFMPASGCPLERTSAPTDSAAATFYKDVLPILEAHCQTCHRQGGVAPFPLVSYEDAFHSAERIREVVEDRRMPPWHARLNPKFGQLLNDKSLPAADIRMLLAWSRQGTPEGDPRDAPEPRQWPDPSAWEIGEPDYVYKIKPFRVPKSGVLEYQFFRVPLNLKEDRWYQAIQVKPGRADVVHHIGLHIVPTSNQQLSGMAAMAKLYGLNMELARLTNDYVPGDSYNAKSYPEGQGVFIPKNSDLIFEVHYTPNNREAVVDQSMVAFRWTAGRPEEEILTRVFRKPVGRFVIPPYASHHRMEDSYYFPHDVYIDAIRPHFHLRGKSYRLELVERDPRTEEIASRETILDVPVFDPNWQRTCELAQPLFVQAGVELLATGHFDNSEFNPNNPDPSAEVRWGQQVYDEMFSTRFKFRRAAANSADAPAAGQ